MHIKHFQRIGATSVLLLGVNAFRSIPYMGIFVGTG